MIDRSRLTEPECDVIRCALLSELTALDEIVSSRAREGAKKDARWRKYVVVSLLVELDG